MGNSHCRPRKGGENLREFLARKFRVIAGKRKIDDLVTIAIEHERTENKTDREHSELHLNLEDLEDYETDSDSDKSSVSKRTPNKTPAEEYLHEDTLEKENEVTFKALPPRQEVVQYKEDNDYIRVLQEQLKQVQSELANLHMGKIDKRQTGVFEREPVGLYSRRSLNSQQLDEWKTAKVDSKSEIAGPTDVIRHMSPRETAIQARGDVTGRSKPAVNIATAADVKKIAADDMIIQNESRRNKPKGMITEGLRTRSDVNHTRAKAKKLVKPKKEVTVEDETKIAAKIAKLQKRDPALPRPDKGIVYPKTMANLSHVDKAYYVEQFLRSELFRQRCLRKYQGSTTWMNGLTPFQLWVLENEGSAEIEAVLHPLAFRQNTAQAKVKCWRGDTPPPPPKSP